MNTILLYYLNIITTMSDAEWESYRAGDKLYSDKDLINLILSTPNDSIMMQFGKCIIYDRYDRITDLLLLVAHINVCTTTFVARVLIKHQRYDESIIRSAQKFYSYYNYHVEPSEPHEIDNNFLDKIKDLHDDTRYHICIASCHMRFDVCNMEEWRELIESLSNYELKHYQPDLQLIYHHLYGIFDVTQELIYRSNKAVMIVIGMFNVTVNGGAELV